MTSGLDLVNKWIERKKGLGMSDEEIDGTRFVFDDTLYTVKKVGEGKFDIDCSPGKIIIFRDLKQFSDEYTCRICGTEYNNKIDTIRCCTNMDE
jgi:hypothetical protein